MIFFGKKGEKRVFEGEVVTSEKEILEKVKNFLNSEKREEMLCGARYYEGINDILSRKRMVIGEDGTLVEDKNLSNCRIAHSFFKKLVDQKAEYLFGREFSVSCENEEFSKILNGVFDAKLKNRLKNLCKEAVVKGIGWLYVYFENGELRFKKIPSEEVIPIWSDSEKLSLDGVIRVYGIKRGKKILTAVEKWDLSGVYYYILENGRLYNDPQRVNSQHITLDGMGYNFMKIPFIPFKYNEEEISLIRYTKSLIDDYDLLKSDDSNTICDVPNSILVVKNYDGQGLGEFRKNLSRYKAVKVTDDGGLDVKSSNISTDMVARHLSLDRKDLYEAGRGVDTQTEDFKNASGVALKFLYADLDLDCNGIESEFLVSLGELMYFVKLWLEITGKGDFKNEDVSFVLNRDIIVNESEAIEECVKSADILSEVTILENHPWVKDAKKEKERKDNENGRNASND